MLFLRVVILYKINVHSRFIYSRLIIDNFYDIISDSFIFVKIYYELLLNIMVNVLHDLHTNFFRKC